VKPEKQFFFFAFQGAVIQFKLPCNDRFSVRETVVMMGGKKTRCGGDGLKFERITNTVVLALRLSIIKILMIKGFKAHLCAKTHKLKVMFNMRVLA
jgi:hypothetical protein